MNSELLLNMYKFAACKKLFSEMKDLPYAVVKGEVLSLMIYNEEGHRQYTDIDILIPREKICELERCLKENGFISTDNSRENRINLLLNSHQIAPWEKAIGTSINKNAKIVIDINFDIFWGEYEKNRIDIEGFLKDTEEVKVYGVNVKTLSPIKAFIQLVLHHYKDMNSIFLLSIKKTIDINKFQEIRGFLYNNREMIPAIKLAEVCSEYDIKEYVYYILYYTKEIFKDDFLEEYLHILKCANGEVLLDKYGLNALERKIWRVDFITRLKEGVLFKYMLGDLTKDDLIKIETNKKIFMGSD